MTDAIEIFTDMIKAIVNDPSGAMDVVKEEIPEGDLSTAILTAAADVVEGHAPTAVYPQRAAYAMFLAGILIGVQAGRSEDAALIIVHGNPPDVAPRRPRGRRGGRRHG